MTQLNIKIHSTKDNGNYILKDFTAQVLKIQIRKNNRETIKTS